MADDKKVKAAVYCRVSTYMDRQDGSLEMQSEHYKKLISKADNMVLVGIYADQGKSGRTIKGRPDLKRLLDDCRKGEIDLILTKSISRFARNMKEFVETVRWLSELGVRVYFEKENIDTNNMAGELFMTIMATLAEEESNSISQNVKWSRKRNYQMGRPIEKASYGFRSSGKEHIWEICEPEAERVRLAFYMAANCYNNAQIRNALNVLEEEENTGKVWKQTPVMNLLHNLAYVGDYLSNKETVIYENGEAKRRKNRGEAEQFYISEHHEPIVSHELFDCVQEIIDSKLLFVHRRKFTESELQLMERGKEMAEEEFRGKIFINRESDGACRAK